MKTLAWVLRHVGRSIVLKKEYFHSIIMENITSKLGLMSDMIQNPAAEKLVLYLCKILKVARR